MYIEKFNRLLKRTGEARSYLALAEGERDRDESHQTIYRAIRITNRPGEVLKRSERRNSYNSGS
jgi:hypothetical protein